MNKMLLGLIIIAVVVGGAILLMNRNQNSQSLIPQGISPTETMPSQAPLTVGPTQASQMKQKEVVINVSTSGFDSSTVTVAPGTKITWVNKSGTDVSINSDPHPTHTNYPPLNLGRVSDGQSVSLVFDKTGRYGYHNHLSPDQTGTIIVQ